MRPVRIAVALSVLAIFFALGCSNNRSSNPALKDNVKKALQQADLQKVTVDEDRGKNLITLGGTSGRIRAGTEPRRGFPARRGRS